MTKRWQCTVCGYIHEGDQPPDVCPVCGADRSKFVALDTETIGLLQSMRAVFRLHPVAAHFPNGLIPSAAVFLLLFAVTGRAGFEATAYWLLLFAAAVVPVSIGSGLRDWQQRFGGRREAIFVKKIALAITLLCLALGAFALRHGTPDLLIEGGAARWLYLLCVAGMLGCATLLGHYGSLLAAREVAERPAGQGRPATAARDWAGEIVAGAPDAILAADARGTIRFWNSGAERLFGISADEAIGQTLDLIIPETLRQRHWAGWSKALRAGESAYARELLQVPARRADGSRFSCEFSIVMLKDAKEVTGVAAILRDVTVRWEQEKRLQQEVDTCRGKARPQST